MGYFIIDNIKREAQPKMYYSRVLEVLVIYFFILHSTIMYINMHCFKSTILIFYFSFTAFSLLQLYK